MVDVVHQRKTSTTLRTMKQIPDEDGLEAWRTLLEDHEPYTSGCGPADESDCGRLSVLRNFGVRD